MKTKNKKELVLRADGHARLDRLTADAYADAGPAGDGSQFTGCAIGCLATSHRLADLRKAAKNGSLESASEDLVRRLGEEFGITAVLARAAEGVFENLSEDAGRQFVPAFARALPEGVDIRPAQVEGFWRKQGLFVDKRADRNSMHRLEWASMRGAPHVAAAFLTWLQGLS